VSRAIKKIEGKGKSDIARPNPIIIVHKVYMAEIVIIVILLLQINLG